MRRAALAFLPLVAGAAALAAPEPRGPPVPGLPSSPGGQVEPDARPSWLDELSLLATGHPATPSARERYATAGIDAFVDLLLSDPEFARTVGPDILLGSMLTAPSSASRLMAQLAQLPGSEPRYTLAQPCATSETEVVHPWWAPGDRVRVCPSAHRPRRLVDPAHPDWHCDGANLTQDNSRACGCGPHLMFCVGGPVDQEHMAASLRAEVRDTIAHVIEHDRPLRDVYTMNETVRDGRADFYYQRGRLLAGEITALPDPRALSSDAGPRRRPESWPGQHAGILTTYHLLYLADGVRDRLRDYYSLMWCVEGQSQGVTTEDILALGVTDLRAGAGWKQLAAMPVCTGCHARLDYGVQFFLGQPSSYVAHHALPGTRGRGRGPMYGRDIDDARGHGPLNALGFAELAVAQPEFAACMARKVTTHVFDRRARPDDLRAVRDALAARGTLRAMMRTALLRHAAARTTTAASPQAGALRRDIDAHCTECHDEGALDLRADPVPQATLRAMLPQVAFRAMPRGEGLDPATRRRMIAALIDELYPQGPARNEARWYFLDGQAAPVHRSGALANVVLANTGAAAVPVPPGGLRPVETLIPPDRFQLTPGLATQLALEALDACRHAGHREDALSACLSRAAPPAAIMRGGQWSSASSAEAPSHKSP